MDARSPAITPPLVDPFGRAIRYVRVSVTDRCDFRCAYCMSEDMNFLPRRDVLSLEELDRLCSAFVRLGTRRLRITGGEPLVRRDVMKLFRALSRHLDSGALDELTLTTNGSQLARFAGELFESGVRRVNVSLDTLDPGKFRAITRWGDLNDVMAGIDAAEAAGLKIKINTVALKGFNDDEAPALVEWAHGRGFDLTFIEVMPLGAIESDRFDQFLPLTVLRSALERRLTLTASGYESGGPARYFDVAETGGRLGFITPLTHNFCERCNRVRVTCTGRLYLCLGHDVSADLRAPLRRSPDDDVLEGAIRDAIRLKPQGHDFIIERAGSHASTPRHMNVTGG
jgi:cyclic pyranopterin phosphate synthase